MRPSPSSRAILCLWLLITSISFGQARVASTARIAGASRVGPNLASPTPQMGWSTWPGVSCPLATCSYPSGVTFTPPTEAVVEAESAKLADPALTGLCAVEYPPAGSGCVSLTGLGYNLVALDVGWNQCVSGSPPCVSQPIPSQFPDGISGVATYVHARGQLLSLYGSPGLTDCQNYPAQYQNEVADINLVASWGVDEWRYDWCPSSQSIYGSSYASNLAAYKIVGDAIANTGRLMGYDLNNTINPPFITLVGGSRVRIGGDNPGPGGWAFKFQSGYYLYAVPYQSKGHWLDFDILMGNYSENNTSSPVGDVEARAQFNAYAVTASSMIIGAKIEDLDSTNLQTYSNSEVIAVNQDSIGKMGTLVATTTCGATTCQVWKRPLASSNPACVITGHSSCVAVALINFDPSAGHSITANWSDIGIAGTWNIRDLWTHASAGSSATSYVFSAAAWGSNMVVLSQ